MPSIGHLAVGMAAGRGSAAPERRPWPWIGWCTFLSVAADLDLAALALEFPPNTPLSHRGLSHSLAVSVLAGVLSALVARRFGIRPLAAGLVGFVAYVSHLVLDCLSFGSVGVPWLWPFSSQYYTLPVAPIPAVIELRDFLTWQGVRVVAAEGLIFLPFFVYGLFGWRRQTSRRAPGVSSDRPPETLPN